MIQGGAPTTTAAGRSRPRQQQQQQRRRQGGHGQQQRGAPRRRASALASASTSASASALPATAAPPAPFLADGRPIRDLIPRLHLDNIEEPAAKQMLLERMVRIPLPVPGFFGGALVDTAVVPPPPQPPAARTTRAPAPPAPSSPPSPSSLPPVVCLHGFDSSSLEFRRLHPLLASEPHGLEPWAIDLVGWGFTDAAPFSRDRAAALPPAAKRAHLLAFWRERLDGRPMLLVGASLGGAVAMDFAVEHPEAVAGLALIDPQAFVDGLGPPPPRSLAEAGVWLLRSVPLRQAANRMAYFDKDRFATADAMRCGRLHTHLPGWSDANVAWMGGGGYVLPAERVEAVARPTLLMWGREDGILSPALAPRLEATLSGAGVLEGGATAWLERCGHCGHLEQPEAVAAAIGAFARRLAAAGDQA